MATPFDRVTYREGQRLDARDLADDHDRELGRARLHVRNLHETWGIAIGFEVQAAGPSAVAVGPGYALDELGRPLVLAASLAVPVPAVTGPQAFVLVATFGGDGSFGCAGTEEAVCLDDPVGPRRERPALAWCTPPELEPGPMVPLGSVVVQGKAMKGGVQTRVRRYARRFARPYVGSGVSDTGREQWSFWWQRGILHGVEQRVSTREAEFTDVPKYFATLLAARPSEHHTQEQVAEMVAQAHGHVLRSAADSFVYRLIVPEPFLPDLWDTWAVSWVGVQPLAGCPPALDLKRLLMLGALLRLVR